MKTLTAYLIDDDYATNFFNDIMFKKSGLFNNWRIFLSAAEALENLQIAENTPDIILLDINMPVISGWDFIDKYEALAIDQKCNCIVMLSTSLNRFDSEKIEDRPRVKAYQAKPLSPSILKDLHQLVLQQKE